MKLGTVRILGAAHPVALLDASRVLLLDDAAEQRKLDVESAALVSSILSVIQGGDRALEVAAGLIAEPPEAAVRDLSAVQMAPPLPNPPLIRDTGCFFDHFRNIRANIQGIDVSEVELSPVMMAKPLYYVVNRMGLAAHDDDITWPSYSAVRDYELELGCVLGRTGRDIAPEDALGHIFGFTLFNDFTARDTQREEMSAGLGMSKGKDFDRANVFGPWIVTVDEFDDVYDIEMCARVNNEEVSRGNTSLMDHRWEDVLSWISAATTLHAGEIIGSGTVPMGCGVEHGRLLEVGDVIELEADRIGVLRNRIIA